jgi:hypothetical protein
MPSLRKTSSKGPLYLLSAAVLRGLCSPAFSLTLVEPSTDRLAAATGS